MFEAAPERTRIHQGDNVLLHENPPETAACLTGASQLQRRHLSVFTLLCSKVSLMQRPLPRRSTDLFLRPC